MDDIQFDRLTRRFVLGGLAAGSLSALLADIASEARGKGKRTSKAKRCRQKKRTFCAGRCCPKSRRCENKACVGTCADPFVCGAGGAACAANDACFCSTSITGASACVVNEPGLACTNLQACSADAPCPAGQICGSCFCDVDVLDFRCQRPCQAG